MNKDNVLKIQEEITSFINELGIEAQVQLTFEEDDAQGSLICQIESLEAAALIGFHGETLQSLQLILSFLVHKSQSEWVKILVNVGDYRQKREEQLHKLALNLAMKAKFSGEAQALPNLNSSERRFIHMVLAENPDVYSESEGEGRNRLLMIKPKK